MAYSMYNSTHNESAARNCQAGCENNAGSQMRNLLFQIAKALVDAPDQVVVEQAADGDWITLHVTVAADGIGKLIGKQVGKQGRTAKSIRIILSAVSMKTKQRFALNIVEHNREAGWS